MRSNIGHKYDVVTNTMWSQIRCGHKYGVVTNTVWSQIRCGHKYGVVTNTVWSQIRRGHKYDVVTNTADLLVDLVMAEDLLTVDMWGKLSRPRAWSCACHAARSNQREDFH